MAIFQPRPFQVPNMRTDYSAENSAWANLGKTLGDLPGDLRKQQALSGLGQDIKDGKFKDAAGKAFALGDTQGAAALLGLEQKQIERDAYKNSPLSGGGLGGSATPMALGSPNEVENRFVGTIQKAGLTNPNGLAAVAAYGKSESGYDPGNVNKTWSDPSESGAAGTSGGIMSWRADRLQNLQRFAAERGEQGNGSPETQAAFLAKEDPTLIPRLNAAKTPQEANQIMANAWRFAGYDRPGGENARREGLTTAYAQRFGAQGSPQPPVQVAENEADVRRLEQAQADSAAPGAAVASGPANTQAQGFAIPGNNLPPNDPRPNVSNKQLIDILGNPYLKEQHAIAKYILDARQKYTDENAPDKREQTRLQTEELRRKAQGEQFTDLVTPEERAAAGVDPNYKGPVQRERSGRLSYPGKPTTEVNMTAEKAQDSTIGKAYGEYFVDSQKGGRDARDQITTMKRMQALIDDPNFYSGWNGGKATAFKKLAVALGVKDAEAAAPNELFEKLSKQAVLDKAGGSFGTGFSNGDRDYIDATTANPNNTPEGNRQILDAGIKVAQRKIEIAKMARDYARANGGRLDAGFDDQLADFAEKNPLFPQATPKAPTPPQAPQGFQAPEGATPPAPPRPPAPRRGESQDGYRYRGGDPSKPESWVKVN